MSYEAELEAWANRGMSLNDEDTDRMQLQEVVKSQKAIIAELREENGRLNATLAQFGRVAGLKEAGDGKGEHKQDAESGVLAGSSSDGITGEGRNRWRDRDTRGDWPF